tara:strand:+ start:634 stop:837 length:204 start_codon:yes stop_codon:yes gene_type:complete
MNLLSFMQSLIDSPTITNFDEVVKAILKSKYSNSDKLEMISEISLGKNESYGLCKAETFMEAFNSRY